MPWTERQHTLLRGIGLRLWSEALPSAPPDVKDEVPHEVKPAVRHDVKPDVASASPASQPSPAPPPTPAGTAPKRLPPVAAAPTELVPPVVAAPAELAPAGAIAHLDWEGLRTAVSGCRACGLCQSRRQTVFGSGHPQAHWMIIGEAPGEQEDLQGEPFVGPAGQLLDRMLAALQLTRAADGPEPPQQRAYIANTLKCRPPGNRNPSPEELARCEPYLLRQIDLLQPRLILAMGRFAAQTLLRSTEPIGRLRGRVHRYHDVPLIVTYHPAYLLRQPLEKARAWEDLCLAAEVAQT